MGVKAMARAGWLVTMAGGVAMGACVTINVYFPAAAAEKAADRIIDEVWGEQNRRGTSPQPGQGRLQQDLQRVFTAALDLVIPAAQAQANLDISTPAINGLQSSMAKRHQSLAPYYDSGAVGLTDEGLIAVRDAKAIPLQDRPTVNALVAAENRDRNALYLAIAQANGHPEWEPDIRATFARRWIERANKGWWSESQGVWRQR
jgi:uncharacterized protein YdbL (DUF1318 family)